MLFSSQQFWAFTIVGLTLSLATALAGRRPVLIAASIWSAVMVGVLVLTLVIGAVLLFSPPDDVALPGQLLVVGMAAISYYAAALMCLAGRNVTYRAAGAEPERRSGGR